MKGTKGNNAKDFIAQILITIGVLLTSCVSGGQTLNQQKVKLISTLSSNLDETSGLSCDTLPGNIPVLRSHNDKGAAPIVYTLNPSNAKIIQSLYIQGITNTDWEDLTQNDSILFIGDTGNNKGKRSDFTIYALPKRQFLEEKDTVLFNGYAINYTYPNQVSVAKGEKHNYDAEAIAFNNGFVYMFSKNRSDDSTVIYRVKDKAGVQIAERVQAFKTGCLVTSATFFKGHWYVLGYQKKGECMLFQLDENLDNLTIVKTTILGQFKDLGQTEAICFDATGNMYMSAEAVDDANARLYRVINPVN